MPLTPYMPPSSSKLTNPSEKRSQDSTTVKPSSSPLLEEKRFKEESCRDNSSQDYFPDQSHMTSTTISKGDRHEHGIPSQATIKSYSSPQPRGLEERDLFRADTMPAEFSSRSVDFSRRVKEAEKELTKLKARAVNQKHTAQMEKTAGKNAVRSPRTGVNHEDNPEDEEYSSPGEVSDEEEERGTGHSRKRYPSKLRRGPEKSNTMPPSGPHFMNNGALQHMGFVPQWAGPSYHPQPPFPHYQPPVPGPYMYGPYPPYPGPSPFYPPPMVHNYDSNNVRHTSISDVGNNHSRNYGTGDLRTKKTKENIADGLKQRVYKDIDEKFANLHLE